MKQSSVSDVLKRRVEHFKNKVEFMLIVTVEDANPNGDPLRGNIPREKNGIGEISPECIKRKIRNRLLQMGRKILYVSEEDADDGYNSISSRLKAEDRIKKAIDANNVPELRKASFEAFEDVRLFGGALTIKGKKQGEGISAGLRGAVTIRLAKSVGHIDIESMQITKSMNFEDGEKKGPDTMGWRHFVSYGVYVIRGSVNPLRCGKNGVTEQDIEDLKEAVCTLFENDESSARPAGSMVVKRVYWWEQNADDEKSEDTPIYSDTKVFNTVTVRIISEDETACSWDDVEIIENDLPGLKPEVIDEP